MSQKYDEIRDTSITDKDVSFTNVELLQKTTETKKTETIIYSLGISKNEPIEDFEKDMEQLTSDSIKDFEEE